MQALDHRLPVVDRRAHVVEDANDVGGKRFEAGRVDHAIDLDMNKRLAVSIPGLGACQSRQRAVGTALHGNDRMHDQMQRQPVAVDLHRHRVDQERHVVVDDFDDGMRGLPAVLFERRIEHPHASAARVALAREVPVRQHRAVEIGRLPLREILGVDVLEIAHREIFHGRALGRRDFRAHELQHLVEALRPAGFSIRSHADLLRSLLASPIARQ